jgi:hypothetical protein
VIAVILFALAILCGVWQLATLIAGFLIVAHASSTQRYANTRVTVSALPLILGGVFAALGLIAR